MRIDVIYGRFSARAQAWIDLLGALLFLLPLCGLMVWLAWPGFVDSFQSGETSPDAGGLIRWPVRLLIPLGFALLGLQGVAEIIKRIAFLRGEAKLTRETAAGGSMSFAVMAPLMFAGLVLFLLLGYPVAFALAANGLLFAVIGIQSGFFDFSLLQALPERVYGIVSNPTLLAIPFFTFMGLVLERSGMAEELLDTVGQLFGRVRGGLAYAVVFVGALLAATTGVMAATVIAMGLISLPIMLRYGYDKRLASGVITASGTLAQIVPPSIVLIVLADQLGASVGDMYTGALAPALMLAGLYLCYVFGVTLVKPHAAPALPPQARTLRGAALARRVGITLIPPLVLIFLVLGTIFLGIATPTEGGALGAAGAVALAALRAAPDTGCRETGHGLDRAPDQLRDFHPHRLDRVQPGVPRRGRRPLGGKPADATARRRDRLPDRGEPAGVRAGLLPRLLRDRLHRGAAAGAGRGQARHRPDLVRRAARHQHADLVPAPAVRLRAVLPAQRRAQDPSAPPTSTGARCRSCCCSC